MGVSSPRPAGRDAQQIVNLADWRRHPAMPRPVVRQQAAVAGGASTAPGLEPLPAVQVVLTLDGPHISWDGNDPDELMLMAVALLDAARAARNGDDLDEVARQEWMRRGGRPELD